MGRLDGKVALITGGARGQGAAEAERFAAEGATVVITDVLDDDGAATASRLGDAVTFVHHDVTSEQEWDAVVGGVVEVHGRIDVLVNNAGIFRRNGLLTTDLDEWDQVVAINQTGVFLGMKAVATVMCEQGAGSIVNISSVAGLRGAGISHAYAATKWAVRGMTKSAAQELGRYGVRVNSVHPGYIETPMLHELGVDLSGRLDRVPLGRTAEPDEVADVVLFLASDDSRYCTGAELTVDGGMTA
jgi:3alpha(or 20beta)-hydroxysteroid dehydrogenase